MTGATTPNEMSNNLRRRQYAILAGLVVFSLALCVLVVVLMLHRGPAVAY